MPDPFAPEGVLPSVLRAIDRPGQIVRNVLKGQPGGALRQGASFLGDVVDSVLPGDWIPDFTRKGDQVEGSDLVGLDESSPQWLRTTADIGVGIATDPLSWISFGAPAAAGAFAKQGAKQALRIGVPFTKGTEVAGFAKNVDPLSLFGDYADKGITAAAKAGDTALGKRAVASNIGGATVEGPLATGYQGAKTNIKRTLGWFDLNQDQKKILAEATATGSRTSKAWVEASRKALDGLSDAERTAIGDAIDGVDWGTLEKSASPIGTIPGTLPQRIKAIANTYNLDEGKLQQAAASIIGISKGQLDEAVTKGAMTLDPKMPQDYLQHMFVKLPEKWRPGIDEVDALGMPSALSKRKLKDSQEIVDFLKSEPEAAYERDAGRRLINRSVQQGRLVERATLGKDVLASKGIAGPWLSLGRKEQQEEVQKVIFEASKTDPDFAYLAKNVFDGTEQRGSVTNFLAGANRWVKPAMVYGVMIPKLGSIVRNQIGMVWQAASTPGVSPADLKKAWFALGDSVNDGYGHFFGLSKRAGDDLGKDIALIDDAYKAAGTGGGDAVLTYLQKAGKPDLVDAVRLGVMDGFVSSEDILKELTRTAGKNKWESFYDAPGVVFQGVEQRGRLAAFQSMRKRMSPELAAQQGKEAFIDYRVTGPENRALRDILPFAQFAAQSVRQQAGAMSRTPVIGATAAQFFQSGDEDPVYPWMENKSRINLGQDEQGNPLWLTGLGLPFESLGMIPNVTGSVADLSQSLREGALSSTQPLLKTAAALTTGRDPYFDSAFGSYDKLPIVGEAGAVGRGVNMALSTGIGEPFGFGIARQIGQATDETKPVGARALDLLTGGKLVSVDPDRAEQLAIQDYLKKRPDIKTFQTYYKQGEKDEEFSTLMGELRDAKARVKVKKEAAAQAGL